MGADIAIILPSSGLERLQKELKYVKSNGYVQQVINSLKVEYKELHRGFFLESC